MEQIAEYIKNLILVDVNAELPALEDEAVSLPAIQSSNVVFGTVDLSRYEADVVVSILPEEQTPEEGFIDGFADSSGFVVTFLCQKAAYSVLVKRMCRYARAFRLAQIKNPDLDNCVEDSEVTQVDFFPDAGVTAQQMTAVEINLTVTTEESLD